MNKPFEYGHGFASEPEQTTGHADASAAPRVTEQATAPADRPDLAELDDDQLISQRATLRTRLGQLPWHDEQRAALEDQYEEFTGEFDRRARAAWQRPEGRQP